MQNNRFAGFVLTVLAVVAMSASVQADEHVNGYYKKDGTYVAPYYRSSPNGTTSDNFSHVGNTNPYTGQPGTKNN